MYTGSETKRSSFLSRNMNALKHLLGKYRHLRMKKITKMVHKVLPIVKSKKEFNRRRIISSTSDRKLKKVNKSDFQLGHLLGAGGFGSVYQGTHASGKSVAVKVLNKPSVSKNAAAQLESYRAELQTLELRHESIVMTFGVSALDSCEEGAWIVMELAGSRTLLNVLNTCRSYLTPDRRLKYASQLASAMEYIHSRNLVHLDIKPANIMITNDDDCKLGDFGCSRKIQDDGKALVSPTERSELTGTFAYRAPELLRGDNPSKKADIYSFGVNLWQMLSKDNPYGNENQHVVIFGVVAYGLRPKHPETVDISEPFEMLYRELYSQCWEADSDKRPSARDLVDVLKTWSSHMN